MANDTNTATNMTCTPAELAVGTCLGTKTPPTPNRDIPGYFKLNHYRVYGSITRLNYDLPFGQIRAGFYYDHADTRRERLQYDITQNRAPDPRQSAPAQSNPLALANINYDQNSDWNNYQPFVDFEWRVTPDLTITPGIKYVQFTRNVTGPVNQGPRTNIPYSATFNRTLYFLTANYHIRDNWSVYGQFATGFLIPALSTLQVNNPNPSGLRPQTSTNYQIGTVYHGSRVTVDADAYYIDFRNKFIACSPQPVVGEINYCTIPGANYHGVEGQITFRANDNLDVFANGSINTAQTRTSPHTQLANAPRGTAAVGAILHFPQWTLAFSNKYVADQWATEGQDVRYHIRGYNQMDATLVYNLTPRVRLEAAVYNLFDSQAVTLIKTASIPANPALVDVHDQYYFQPGRNFQVSARVSF